MSEIKCPFKDCNFSVEISELELKNPFSFAYPDTQKIAGIFSEHLEEKHRDHLAPMLWLFLLSKVKNVE